MNEVNKITDAISIKTGKGFSEGLYADVNMHIQHFDGNGALKGEQFIHNLVTTAGKNGSADQLLATPTLGKPTHMAVGTGATPAATLLTTEVARVALTSKTRSGAVVTMVGDFPAGTGTGNLQEAGVFDVATANAVNMWVSAGFASINKLAADSLSVTWTITYA